MRRVVILVIVAAVVVGISLLIFRPGRKSSSSTTTSTTTPTSPAQLAANKASKEAGCPESPSATLPAPTWKSPPPMTIDPSKTYTATIKTDVGTITANLDAKTAPTAVNDFVFLVNQKYYNCVTFHRVIPQFMDQTGDPTGTGTGSVGYTVQGEVPATASPQYPIGSLAMAKTSASAERHLEQSVLHRRGSRKVSRCRRSTRSSVRSRVARTSSTRSMPAATRTTTGRRRR